MEIAFAPEEIAAIVTPRQRRGATTETIRGIAALGAARAGDLSFLGNAKYRPQVASTLASIVFLPSDYPGEPGSNQLFLIVDNPSVALARICARIEQALWPKPAPGVHATASIAPGVVIPAGVTVGPLCVIEAGAVIGAGTHLQGQVFIGRGAILGAGCWLMPGSVVAAACVLQDRVRLQPGVVIGSDGFGYDLVGGRLEKQPQIGRVVVHDDVEIGANTTVDRGRFSDTVIGEGTKIDNLVQVGHNVVIGRHCLIVAQTGISGSTTLEDYVVLGGQVGTVGHITVGRGTKVGAQSGINHDLPAGSSFFGNPCLPYLLEQRLTVLRRRLPDLFKRVDAIEEKLQEMLQSLRIRNLALLEEVALDFEAGFTAVTGETGAGKSILLGALSLLAGERADKTIIRQGAPACEVEASLYFDHPGKIDGVLAELGLPPCEDGLLILKRSVPRDKAPKLTVNGSLATLAALQQLGEHWIDFHGPSEPRRLLKDACQLELLDLFGRNAGALAAYRVNYRAWRDRLGERDRAAGEERLSPDQIEFTRNQLAKIDSLELTAEAIEALERDFQRMNRSQELIGLAEALAGGLTGEEGVQERLAALLREARRLEGIDPASAALAERLSSAMVELNDLAAEFTALGQKFHRDPEQAALLATRMDAWLDVKRKHGDLASVIAARDGMRERLERQGDLAGVLARLEQQAAEAGRAAKKDARALRLRREQAAKELGRVAARTIAELGFQKADFQIRVVPLAELGPAGDSGCEFLFSPNAGEPLLPLNRVASSGELARVMLALKAVLADLDGVPLLVFDEVDANVGGEIGRVVGEKMAAIGKSHQVLCVTHLPQVAAQATCHLVVEKDQTKERVVVTIVPIQSSRKGRVAELARMLGDRNAKSALAHADQLLGR